ncbi:hypothetical protein BB561_003971 [Smittium simulii]|uniref:Probable quinone oxidoreductase n=1 Tax=Smittium simulii TaxID=133385 RepID=A0A2T9YIN4_9FUNG|nr:hypothetical protein BB561_003971 [Smittium simulii]
MKAIQVLKPGNAKCLVYATVPKPTVAAKSILVRNAFSGVNYIDTYIRTGLYPTKMPAILGREGSGIIEQVGRDVHGFNIGDRIAYLATENSYAEFCNVEPKSAVKLPQNVSLEVGAASLIQGLTAITLVRRSYQVKKGDTILVHAAAGGTGRLVVQLCKHLGATVIGTVSTEEKAAIATGLGADHIIYYTKEDVAEKVRGYTNGEMVHAVFDGVGKNTFQGSFDSLKRCGTLVSFGNASGKVPPIEINMLSKGNIVLLRPMLYSYIATPEEFSAANTELFDLISKKVLDINICKQFDLKDATLAHEFIEARKTTGKVLLKIAHQ